MTVMHGRDMLLDGIHLTQDNSCQQCDVSACRRQFLLTSDRHSCVESCHHTHTQLYMLGRTILPVPLLTAQGKRQQVHGQANERSVANA